MVDFYPFNRPKRENQRQRKGRHVLRASQGTKKLKNMRMTLIPVGIGGLGRSPNAGEGISGIENQ